MRGKSLYQLSPLCNTYFVIRGSSDLEQKYKRFGVNTEKKKPISTHMQMSVHGNIDLGVPLSTESSRYAKHSLAGCVRLCLGLMVS